MEIDQKALTVLKTEVSTLETQSQSVTIETPEDYKLAVDLVSKLKETGSRIKKQKESITKPLNEALRNARILFTPIEKQFDNAEAIIKQKLLSYKRRVDEEARKKEAAIAKKVESGRMKLETGEKKIAEVQRVEQTTRGNIGEVQIRKVKKVRIKNRELIPDQYLVPDMVAIRRDALSGIAIPGIEVYEEETVAAGVI